MQSYSDITTNNMKKQSLLFYTTLLLTALAANGVEDTIYETESEDLTSDGFQGKAVSLTRVTAEKYFKSSV